MKKVCIFIEQSKGILTLNSQKVLFMAQTLKKQYGYMIIAVVLDQEIEGFLPLLKKVGIDFIYYIKLNMLNRFLLKRCEIMSLASFLEKLEIDIIWACNSFIYRIIFPKIAYILHTGLCAACFDFKYDIESDRIDMIRTAYSDNAYVQIAVHRSKPLMATILDDGKTYEFTIGHSCSEIYDITSDIISSEISNVETEMVSAFVTNSLNTSKIVIGIGNGITEKSDLILFKELAALLNNAAIGCTRELINKQIMPQRCQIGSTGAKIYADLYIAFGISGSPQHVQGIEHVKKIIAVNHDPYAAIFKYSNCNIIGDLYEVMIYMINYLKERRI